MAKTYKVDVRYVAVEDGIGALERVSMIKDQIASRGYVVEDVAVFDDGMRVSLTVGCLDAGIHELVLLALVSKTGTIGRFSCRDIEKIEKAERASVREADAVLV